MSDPDPEAIERWLQSQDPNDPTVRVHDIEPLTIAAEQLHNAVADARERGVPLQLIGMLIEDLEDRLSVLLRTGETFPRANCGAIWASAKKSTKASGQMQLGFPIALSCNIIGLGMTQDEFSKLFRYMTERFDKLDAELAKKADADEMYRRFDDVIAQLDDIKIEQAAQRVQLDRHMSVGITKPPTTLGCVSATTDEPTTCW